MVTGEANPRLIFRIYRHGTYSDFAEGYGMYHRLSANEEIQAPLYAVYDLCDGKNFGPTNFQGFVEMYVVGDYAPKNNVWRWGVADTPLRLGLPEDVLVTSRCKLRAQWTRWRRHHHSQPRRGTGPIRSKGRRPPSLAGQMAT